MNHSPTQPLNKARLSLHKRQPGQAGFSVIELIVSLGITLTLLAAAFTLMSSTIKVSHATFEMTDAQQGLRTAQEYINRDLTVAGDGLRGISDINVNRIFVTDHFTTNPIIPALPAAAYVNLALVTANNNVAAGTVTAVPATAYLTGSDRLTMLTRDATFAPINRVTKRAGDANGLVITTNPADAAVATSIAATLRAGEIYFITNGSGAVFGVLKDATVSGTTVNCSFTPDNTNGILDYGLNDAPASLQTAVQFVTDDDPANQVVIMRVKIIHYFVNTQGQIVRRVYGINSTGIPASTNAAATNKAFADSVIAENVTDLQFRYGLSWRTNNGALATDTLLAPVNSFHENGDDDVNMERQKAVRQVESTVTVRTAHVVNNNQRPTVQSTTTTGLRNLGFREAPQPEATPTPVP